MIKIGLISLKGWRNSYVNSFFLNITYIFLFNIYLIILNILNLFSNNLQNIKYLLQNPEKPSCVFQDS